MQFMDTKNFSIKTKTRDGHHALPRFGIGHRDITAFAYSDGGPGGQQLIFSCGQSYFSTVYRIMGWDVSSMNDRVRDGFDLMRSYNRHSAPITSLAVRNCQSSMQVQLLSTSCDGYAGHWDVTKKECIQKMRVAYKYPLNHVCVSLDGNMAYYATDAKAVFTFDLRTGQCVRVMGEGTRCSISVLLSSSPNILAVGGEFHHVSLYDIRNTHKSLKMVEFHKGECRAMVSSSSTDVARLYIGCAGTQHRTTTVFVMDEDTLRFLPKSALMIPRFRITSLMMVNDDKDLCITSYRGTCNLMALKNGVIRWVKTLDGVGSICDLSPHEPVHSFQEFDEEELMTRHKLQDRMTLW